MLYINKLEFQENLLLIIAHFQSTSTFEIKLGKDSKIFPYDLGQVFVYYCGSPSSLIITDPWWDSNLQLLSCRANALTNWRERWIYIYYKFYIFFVVFWWLAYPLQVKWESIKKIFFVSSPVCILV